jgi:hypothetical protein
VVVLVLVFGLAVVVGVVDGCGSLRKGGRGRQGGFEGRLGGSEAPVKTAAIDAM